MTIDVEQFAADTVALWREPVKERWSPRWAPNVIGFIGSRYIDGEPQPQKYRCLCLTCGTEHRGECLTGAVRNHVTQFAGAHLHADPLAVPKPPVT